MNPTHQQTVEERFLSIVELSPDEQHQYLTSLSREAPSLADQLRGLLQADASNDDGMFDQPATALSELTPVRVGRYRITRRLNEGGMGTVYEAHSDHPARTVAVKVIRAGLSTDRVMRRFEAESETLGLLDHPGIVRICEAGVCQTEYPDGAKAERPFLAMELVEGPDLLTYADRSGLDERARLGLFAHVCDAIHYAHQRGVIHRDLKPANILVHRDGQPKVLDFGVATLTEAGRQALTTMTRTGQIIGTPAYMSPEQTLPGPHASDVRSDVFSLGVILHELLTGDLPKGRTHSGGTTHPGPRTGSGKPSSDVRTIIERATAAEPDRRYQSAGDLAADLRRFLAGEPIEARPAGTIERAIRFARANRPVVGAILATMIALTAGGTIAIWEAIVAFDMAAKEVQARHHADIARDEAQATLNFVTEMLAAADPDGHGKDVTVKAVIDRMSAHMPDSWTDRPLVAAAIEDAIGRTYATLGEFQLAKDHLQRAHAARLQDLGRDDLLTAATAASLGSVLCTLGEYTAAEDLLEDALEVRLAKVGADNPLTHAVLATMAEALQGLQRFDEAERTFERIIETTQGTELSEPALRARMLYASLLSRLGKYERADAIFKQILPRQQAMLGADSLSVLQTMRGAATTARALGRNDEARSLLESIVARQDRVLGPDHSESLGTLHDLSILLINTGRAGEAEPLVARVIIGATKSLGATHRNTLKARMLLAHILMQTGRHTEAASLAEEVLTLQRQSVGDRNVDVADTLQMLGSLHMAMGDLARGESLLSESISQFSSLLSARNVTVAAIRIRHGECLAKLGRHGEAITQLQMGYEDLIQSPAHAAQAAKAAREIATCLEHLGRTREAQEWMMKPGVGGDS